MQIAIVLFPRLTVLDAIGPYQTLATSVCTGSLVLAAAGLLTGRRATSHWLALEQLARFGAVPVTERVVFDEKYATAAGVSAGIDMGLTLAGRMAWDEVAQSVQLMLEYDPQPPYQAGSPDRVPEIAARFRAGSRYPQPAGVAGGVASTVAEVRPGAR